MHPSWQQLLGAEKAQLELIEQQLLLEPDLTPPLEQVMRPFFVSAQEVRVLILGQDPYPTKAVACGLAFAVADPSRPPRSLVNLMRELEADLPNVSSSGDLARWAASGVLLLNAALSTRVGESAAHQRLWSTFTARVVSLLDEQSAGSLVVLSLGEQAKKLAREIKRGVVIQAPHPSPLSAHRGFFGSRVFSRVNEALIKQRLAPIDWSC